MLPRFLTQPTQQVNWASPLNQGLVSWWLALPGRTGGGTWFDLCGRNHGTLTGMDPATDWVGSARRGGYGALDCDASNDTVLFTSPVSGLPLTIIGWFRTTSSANTTVAMVSSSSGSYTGLGVNAFAVLSYTNSAAAGNVNTTSTGTFSSGVWTMGAAVWESGGNRAAYRDGANKGTSSSALSPSLTDGCIGSFRNSSSYFNGQLDCIRVYNRALSDAEIFALYLEDMLGNPTTLNRIRRPLAFDTGAGGGGGGLSIPIASYHYQHHFAA